MLHHLTVLILLPFGGSVIGGNRGEHRHTTYAYTLGISCVCRKCCLGRTDALGVGLASGHMVKILQGEKSLTTEVVRKVSLFCIQIHYISSIWSCSSISILKLASNLKQSYETIKLTLQLIANLFSYKTEFKSLWSRLWSVWRLVWMNNNIM